MKSTGCCTICDKEVFDILERYPSYLPDGTKHPHSEEARKVGLALPDAKRVTFVLLDGSHCDLTFCSNCTPGKISDMWKKCIESTIFDALPDTRAKINEPSIRYKFDTREQMICAKFLINLVYNIPFGELYAIEWSYYNA